MRDYLYIPLGGNRVSSNARLYTNLVVVFAISGIWHGASWNFLLWGLYHGAFLILDRLFLRKALDSIPAFCSRIITFHLSLWLVFFAIEDFSVASEFISLLVSPQVFDLNSIDEVFSNISTKQLLVLASSVILTSTALYDRIKLPTNRPVLMSSVGVVLWLLSICYLAGSDFNPFIYFRF